MGFEGKIHIFKIKVSKKSQKDGFPTQILVNN